MFFDTIGAFLSARELEEIPFQKRMRSLLFDIIDVKNDNWESFSGDIPMFKGRLRIKVNSKGIRICKQSFSKLYFGTNLKLIKKEELFVIIDWLENITQLPFSKAIVNRLDYGPNIKLRKAPTNYLRVLGNCKGYDRYEQPTGLYFNAKKGIKQVFYDKGLEATNKQIFLMRYEIRLLRNVSSILELETLTFKHLFLEEIEIRLIEFCHNEFNRIEKLMSKHTLKSTAKPSILKDQLALIGLIKFGQNEINNIIESWRKELQLNPTQVHRMKSQIRDLKKLKNSNGSKLIDELDNALIQSFEI